MIYFYDTNGTVIINLSMCYLKVISDEKIFATNNKY